MSKYTIKDLNKVLTYMQETVKASIVNIEITDMHRLEVSATDASGKHVLITVYASQEESNLGTKMPEITETRRL